MNALTPIALLCAGFQAGPLTGHRTSVGIPAVAYTDTYDVVSGQSLSTGGTEPTESATMTALSTLQAYGNMMPAGLCQEYVEMEATGICLAPAGNSLVPLVEKGYCVASGCIGESPRSGYANYVSSVSGGRMTVVSGSRGGATYANMKSGTLAFANLSNQVALMNHYGSTPGWILLIHGESDEWAGTTRVAYAADLVEYQADVTTLTGASSTIPMQVWQTCNSAMVGNTTPLADYDAARAHSKIILGGTECVLTHNAGGTHLTDTESRRLGAMAGKVRAVGTTWEPLWPLCTRSGESCSASPVARTGDTIVLSLHVPVPPLAVGSAVSQRGFSYSDSSGNIAISSVDCSAACTGTTCSCTIVLASDPTGHTSKFLRYQVQTPHPAGDVCDSDAATWEGASLVDCLVAFEEAVP